MSKKKNDNENVAADEQHDGLLNEEDYDAAFEQASGDTPVASAEVSEEEEELEAQTGSAEDEGSETTPPSGEGEEETPPATETPAPAAADTEALRSRITELETQLAEQTTPTETPAATPEQPAALSEEDQETLDEVAEDWPLINRTLEIRIKQLEDRIAQLIDQKVGVVQETIKPIAKTAKETAQEKFRNAVTEVHTDAFELLPEVEKWVEAQPDYLQPGYNNVLDRGSVKQVCDLLNTFKQATGRPLPSDKTDDPPPEQQGRNRDDRLARMEGVRTQRTGVSTEDDPSDFDGAFEKAASQ